MHWSFQGLGTNLLEGISNWQMLVEMQFHEMGLGVAPHLKHCDEAC
jgi:hypothetical protein